MGINITHTEKNFHWNRVIPTQLELFRRLFKIQIQPYLFTQGRSVRSENSIIKEAASLHGI
jgi:hypothetical protein